ncbi:hypothetical protein QBK95_11850 [Aquimarina sp. 2201CG14-23]|nr:hypothetical protein [Aquimarina sp. 2201CG14-23]
MSSRIILFSISLLVFGFSISYKIDKSFNNYKLFSVFGLVLFRTRLEIDFPDYISVFSGSFSAKNEWSTVSALGIKERHEKIVIRFFTNNKNVTLYKTDNYDMALQKAKTLSKLLNVELYDATKS